MILVGKYPSIKVKADYSCFIKFDYNQTMVDLVKTLPVRYYEPTNKVWEVPISDLDRVVNLFGKDNISSFTDFPEFYRYLESLDVSKTNKKSIEELIDYYETIQPIVDYNFKTKPDGHQIECFNKALDLNNLFITDVMGLGKSKEAIDICDYRKSIGLSKHVLIVCGLNGLKYNWHEIEIPMHSWNSSQVIDGTGAQKIEKLNSYWMFYYNIVNIEAIRSTEQRSRYGKIEKENDNEFLNRLIKLCDAGKFDIIVVDEFHKANNHKSQQGVGLRSLHSKSKMALSGTPITKRVERSWSILNWMGLEAASYWDFVKRYCILGGFSGWDIIGYQNLDELHERFDTYQIRRPKGILKLPPKVSETIYIELSAAERKEYNLIKRGLLMDAESGELRLLSPGNAIIPLRQFTDKVKLRALKEKVDELSDNDEACVIYSMFKSAIQLMEDQLKEYNPLIVTGDVTNIKKRQEIISRFQDQHESNVIIGTPQVLGTGYTLTRAQYVLFLNKLWVVTDNEQAEDRCHRRGTTGSVTILSFIVKNSVDERVEEILSNDKKYIDKVVDGIPIFHGGPKAVFDFLLQD